MKRGSIQDYYRFEEGDQNDLRPSDLSPDRGKRKRSYKSKVKLDDEYVLRYFHARIIGQKSGPSMQYVEQAYTDAYRPLYPASDRTRELRAKN